MGRSRPRRKDPLPGPKPLLRAPLEVDEEVDLHGLAVDEALVQAELALARWRGRDGAVIRLIHGHSSGTSGSIKGALKRHLETLWKSRIGAFRGEPGNPGATLVRISNTPPPRGHQEPP